MPNGLLWFSLSRTILNLCVSLKNLFICNDFDILLNAHSVDHTTIHAVISSSDIILFETPSLSLIPPHALQKYHHLAETFFYCFIQSHWKKRRTFAIKLTIGRIIFLPFGGKTSPVESAVLVTHT